MNWLIHIPAGILLAGIITFFLKKNKKAEFKRMALWFTVSNLIDIDHLLANPIYDPLRCSINFHPLHSWFMIPFYIGGLFHKRTRYLSAGIFLHLVIDLVDCILINGA